MKKNNKHIVIKIIIYLLILFLNLCIIYMIFEPYFNNEIYELEKTEYVLDTKNKLLLDEINKNDVSNSTEDKVNYYTLDENKLNEYEKMNKFNTEKINPFDNIQ